MIWTNILTCLLVVALSEGGIATTEYPTTTQKLVQLVPLDHGKSGNGVKEKNIVSENNPHGHIEDLKNIPKTETKDEPVITDVQKGKIIRYIASKILPLFSEAIDHFTSKNSQSSQEVTSPRSWEAILEDKRKLEIEIHNKIEEARAENNPKIPANGRRIFGISKKISGKLGVSASLNANVNKEAEISAMHRVEREMQAELRAKKEMAKTKELKLKYQADIDRLQMELDWLHGQSELDEEEQAARDAEMSAKVTADQWNSMKKEMVAKLQKEYVIELSKKSKLSGSAAANKPGTESVGIAVSHGASASQSSDQQQFADFKKQFCMS